MHFICPVTKLAGNSLLQMLHSEEAVAEGSLASSISARQLHRICTPVQDSTQIATHCTLMIPEDVYHMAVQRSHPRAAFPQVCMERKTGMVEFSSGEAVTAFFALASDFIKWTLLHMITATGNPARFSTCEVSRCWQGNTEGCTRLKPDLKVWKMFFWVPHIFSPLCLTDPELLSAWGGKKSVGIFFSGLISLYGILPLIQLFHRRYS